MIVNVSVVVLLAPVTCLLVTRGGLKAGHAVTALLLGFYLRDTSLAPPLDHAVQSAVDLIGKVRF
ncbi:hypothetical protein [Streptomyces sp. NPDC050704]|uniref:hypothetical protein n=1 Tax=Streptomyces sp. NPDC050704 TaxID=3157219 RepID=UPI0034188C95